MSKFYASYEEAYEAFEAGKLHYQPVVGAPSYPKKVKGFRGSTTPPEFRNQLSTPMPVAQWIIDRWHCTVDLAARAVNKKCPHFFSDILGDAQCLGDGLLDNWTGPDSARRHWVGFCNPPYDDMTPWFKKAINEAEYGFTSCFLVPTFNGDEWAELCMKAREIVFISGRISFIDPQTDAPKEGNNRGSMIAVFGPHISPAPSFGMVDRELLLNYQRP